MTTEKAVAYALGTLQERGQLFVEPGTECYEGMIVGERSKAGDMVVNIARTKNLGNQRSSTSDISVQGRRPRWSAPFLVQGEQIRLHRSGGRLSLRAAFQAKLSCLNIYMNL